MATFVTAAGRIESCSLSLPLSCIAHLAPSSRWPAWRSQDLVAKRSIRNSESANVQTIGQ